MLQLLAFSVYSQKLQMVVKPLMVRKFRRLYGKVIHENYPLR